MASNNTKLETIIDMEKRSTKRLAAAITKIAEDGLVTSFTGEELLDAQAENDCLRGWAQYVEDSRAEGVTDEQILEHIKSVWSKRRWMPRSTSVVSNHLEHQATYKQMELFDQFFGRWAN